MARRTRSFDRHGNRTRADGNVGRLARAISKEDSDGLRGHSRYHRLHRLRRGWPANDART